APEGFRPPGLIQTGPQWPVGKPTPLFLTYFSFRLKSHPQLLAISGGDEPRSFFRTFSYFCYSLLDLRGLVHVFRDHPGKVIQSDWMAGFHVQLPIPTRRQSPSHVSPLVQEAG